MYFLLGGGKGEEEGEKKERGEAKGKGKIHDIVAGRWIVRTHPAEQRHAHTPRVLHRSGGYASMKEQAKKGYSNGIARYFC